MCADCRIHRCGPACSGYTTFRGPVAQRLEQGTHNPLVPGSNPGGPTSLFPSPSATLLRELPALERLQFIERARPIRVQQAREAPVGEQHAASLAAGAIIGFVIGIANSLDGFAAARARFAVAPV